MIDSESTRRIIHSGNEDTQADKHGKESKDLKIAEPKFRKTYLASLVSSSFISPEAIDRKKHLETYFDIRLDPPLLQILDYEPGTEREIKGSIRNFSKTVKRIILNPPKSSRFTLSIPKHHINDEILISPGMSQELIVNFSLSESDKSNRLYTDRITVDIIGQTSVVLPIEAFPISPNLKFDSKLDFEFQISSDSKWVTKDLLICNLGNSSGSFSWVVKSKYIKIIPSVITLDSVEKEGQGSFNVKVAFLPAKIGAFSHTVYLESQTQLPNPKNRAAALNRERIPLTITADVYEHKLALFNRDGSILDTQKLEFGTVYCNQKSILKIKLENNSPEALKWVICHESERSPILSQFSESHSLSNEQSDKSSIVAIPSEGVLEPFKSCKISFEFSPVFKRAEKGWQANGAMAPVKSYYVPMLLKVINFTLEDSLRPGESPISLGLSGKSCPLKFNLTRNIINFGLVGQGCTSFADFEIKNCSEFLGFGFRFDNIAQFEFHPRIGSLQPNSSVTIRVTFVPSQLGNFEQIAQCHIFDLKQLKKSLGKQRLHVIGGSKLEQRIMLNQTVDVPSICKCSITLAGSCANAKIAKSYLDLHNINKPINIDQIAGLPSMALKEDKSTAQKVNPFWEAKVKHNRKYGELLKNNRITRANAQKNLHFGSDGILINSEAEIDDSRNIDRENGLVAPEYIEIDMNLVDHSKTVREQESQSSLNRKIKNLLQRLQDPIAHKIDFKQDHMTLIDYPLSSDELEKIFVSRSDVDFGEVSVHSLNVLPLNFLNTINSSQIIHISLKTLHQDPANRNLLSLSAESIILPSMSLAGVNLIFSSHENGTFKFTVEYTVNQRYKYFVDVRIKVLSLKLQLDTEKIELWADTESSSSHRVVADNDDERIFSPNPVIPTRNDFSTSKAVHKLILKNDGNYLCSFSCYIEGSFLNKQNSVSGLTIEGLLTIDPPNGDVGSGQSKAVTLTYLPGVKSKLEAKIVFKVEDNFEGRKKLLETLIIPFEGKIHSPQCTLMGISGRNSSIDFGILPIQNVPQYASLLSKTSESINAKNQLIVNHSFKIKNISSHPGIFTANVLSGNPDIIFLPSSGIIGGNGNIFELKLQIFPKKIGSFNEILAIYIAGGEKVIKIPMKYEVAYAKTTVDITKSGTSDEVIVGCNSLHQILLRNNGNTVNRYIIDLRLWNTLKILPSSQDQEKQTEILDPRYITEISKENLIYNFNSNNEFDDSKMSGSLYMVEVLPLQESQINLQYSPKSPENINLNIPLILVGGEKQNSISLDLQSVPSPILILTEMIDFKNKVVFENTNITHIKAAKKEKVCFKNNTNQELSWSIKIGSKNWLFQKGIFKLDQMQGNIEPNQTESITILFNPERAERFEAEIFVTVNYLGTTAEFPITIHGNGVKPSVVFDPPELFLPIVAAGSESTVSFSIINYGCERTELNLILDIELEKYNLYLELEYLESKVLKGDGEKIHAAFRFGTLDPSKPTSSISFSTKVEFIDSAKNSFFVAVHGTNDNSLFSLQSCFWKNRKQFCLKMEDSDMTVKFIKTENLEDKPILYVLLKYIIILVKDFG